MAMHYPPLSQQLTLGQLYRVTQSGTLMLMLPSESACVCPFFVKKLRMLSKPIEYIPTFLRGVCAANYYLLLPSHFTLVP